nr:hypothetical protein [Streptomyces sp. S3(2020)]
MNPIRQGAQSVVQTRDRPNRDRGAATGRRRGRRVGRRHAPRYALSRLGHPAVPILTVKNREPIWPDGVMGSHMHGDG